VRHLREFSRFGIACVVCLLSAVFLLGQSPEAGKAPEPDIKQALASMQQQITELKAAVTELRTESERYRSETEALRRKLSAGGRTEVATSVANPYVNSTGIPTNSPDVSVQADQRIPLDEELRLLEGKINDQYQTKVESGSKYRVKLSGMILMNLFGNRGTVDNIDMPGIAGPQGPLFGKGSVGGTLRQSQIGIDVFGPNWAGARVSGDLSFDFAGGFPDASNGVTLGLMRLRTGVVRLDWQKTAVVAGQDAPFFSPLSPTSLATVAEPALSYSGNLWSWLPQVRIERKLVSSGRRSLLLQGGILDSLTGDPPQAQAERLPQAGEISRQPAYAMRLASSWGEGENATTIGVGGYYSRQDWAYGRMVDGWAGTADWQIAFRKRLSLSGEFYRGKSIGGLGASSYHSVLSTGVLNNSQALVQGLNVIGGWSQLKYRATPTLQFNAAYGQDSPFAGQLRQFSAFQNLLDPELGRSQAFMFNFIYKPKSNLLFSTEYRHIDSVRLNQDRFSAEHVNMSIGVLF
jgi:hypothetical protein